MSNNNGHCVNEVTRCVGGQFRSGEEEREREGEDEREEEDELGREEEKPEREEESQFASNDREVLNVPPTAPPPTLVPPTLVPPTLVVVPPVVPGLSEQSPE